MSKKRKAKTVKDKTKKPAGKTGKPKKLTAKKGKIKALRDIKKPQFFKRQDEQGEKDDSIKKRLPDPDEKITKFPDEAVKKLPKK